MDDHAIQEAWNIWLDEDMKLDPESPVLISHSLWDDFGPSEGVVRSLFSSEAASPSCHAKDSASCAFSDERHASLQTNSSWHKTSEYSPPLKRRRTSNFTIDEQIDIEESFENHSNSVIETCEDLKANGPSSSSSVWFMANEESISSVEDVVEQPAESWMAGFFSDSDASDAQGLVACTQKAVHAGTLEILAKDPRDKGVMAMKAFKSLPFEGPSQLGMLGHVPGTRGKLAVRKGATQHKHPSSSTEKPTPVAYPFALLKPCGIQGDVTLKDINKRINMAPPSKQKMHAGQVKEPGPPSLSPLVGMSVVGSTPKMHSGLSTESESSSPSSPFSGKCVVALTKIHTEGKGTITIMRTRS